MNPHATNHPISWFQKYFFDGSLDLSPAFQRRPVWSDAQSSYLIDSILNDLPIPEVFVRTITLPDGDTTVEVVDGQQRLRSIIKFFSNDLELTGSDVSPAWLGVTWDRLDPSVQQRFWSFKIVVRELENASDTEVRDMFRRLNANQSGLNLQELRHAQYRGEFITAVEKIADDPWWTVNRIVTPTQCRRMLDVEFVSELLIGLLAGPLDKKKGLDGFYSDYDEHFPDQGLWEVRFRQTRDLTTAVLERRFRGWNSKTEYYSLFLACGRLILDERVLSDAELGGVIARLKVFRNEADEAKKRDSKGSFPRYVTDYADAVTRASTDLARRIYRIRVIEALLLGVDPPEL
ncbi:MAG: DUF262 domain-containing protein [Gemmatimonadota bacterium]|nr:DUF262 domain-containing protein [Gemmatimonadota bacterium]